MSPVTRLQRSVGPSRDRAAQATEATAAPAPQARAAARRSRFRFVAFRPRASRRRGRVWRRRSVPSRDRAEKHARSRASAPADSYVNPSAARCCGSRSESEPAGPLRDRAADFGGGEGCANKSGSGLSEALANIGRRTSCSPAATRRSRGPAGTRVELGLPRNRTDRHMIVIRSAVGPDARSRYYRRRSSDRRRRSSKERSVRLKPGTPGGCRESFPVRSNGSGRG